MSDYGVILQQVINGLSLGAMYALLALGFTLVYGILELINFAHFNVFMVASFVGMWALQLLGISGQDQVLTGMALAAHLRQHGVTVGEVRRRYGAEGYGSSLYITDPDGNVVELKGPPEKTE